MTTALALSIAAIERRSFPSTGYAVVLDDHVGRVVRSEAGMATFLFEPIAEADVQTWAFEEVGGVAAAFTLHPAALFGDADVRIVPAASLRAYVIDRLTALLATWSGGEA